MEKTTIAISRNIKEQMQEFGYKGESYSDLIKRLIESAKQRQLHDLLMNEKNTISIEEALSNAKKQWQK
jgi:predicted CopG family antitoxin